MGSTNWRYYTPHRKDPADALAELRRAVYQRGEYVDVTGPLDDVLRKMVQRSGQDPDAPEARAIVDDALRMQRAMDTGSDQGLSRAERGMMARLREFTKLAESLGAAPAAGPRRKHRTLDELLEQSAECGTHSILDIERVARRPGFAAASPLAQTSLRKVFGSLEPTHDQVEARWSDIAEGLGPWHARYLTVFREGKPYELAFIGCSGD
jgi:hypothetical protein